MKFIVTNSFHLVYPTPHKYLHSHTITQQTTHSTKSIYFRLFQITSYKITFSDFMADNFESLKVSKLLKKVGNQGKYQMYVFFVITILNFVAAIIMYSLFYIFYQPDYICQDSLGNEFVCPKEVACQPGQKFTLDKCQILSIHNY